MFISDYMKWGVSGFFFFNLFVVKKKSWVGEAFEGIYTHSFLYTFIYMKLSSTIFVKINLSHITLNISGTTVLFIQRVEEFVLHNHVLNLYLCSLMITDSESAQNKNPPLWRHLLFNWNRFDFFSSVSCEKSVLLLKMVCVFWFWMFSTCKYEGPHMFVAHTSLL